MRPSPSRNRCRSWAERSYRLLLRLCPRSLKTRYADEMLTDFRRMRLEAGTSLPARLRSWGALTFDLACTLVEAWSAVLRTPRRPSQAAKGEFMQSLIQDLRFAVRIFAAKPAPALVAVLTLAIGIAAATSIFSVVDAVLLRPLPFLEPDRLVMIWEAHSEGGEKRQGPSPANFLDWKEGLQGFDSMAAYHPLDRAGAIGREGELRPVQVGLATSDFFTVLGARPLLGRTFTWQDGRGAVVGPSGGYRGGPRLAVISHPLWVEAFGSDPAIADSSIVLDGESWIVAGVMPPDFQAPEAEVDLWRPWDILASAQERGGEVWRDARYMHVVARLAEGVSSLEASQELEALASRLAQLHPKENGGWTARLSPLKEEIVAPARPYLLILLAAVGLALLTACGNAAGVLLARAAGRWRELAVRAALGASSGRLMRQMLSESLLLAGAGGLLGAAMAFAGLPLLLSWAPEGIPRLSEVSLDLRLLAVALGLTLLTSLIFGLAPAIYARRTDPARGIQDGGRTPGLGRHGVRRALVVAEVAAAVLLLTGAGLLVQSFLGLAAVDPGFDADDLVTFRVSLDPSRYDAPRSAEFYRRLRTRILSLPEVVSAAAITRLPMQGLNDFQRPYRRYGQDRSEESASRAHIRMVTPGYFRTMRIPLLAGRVFEDSDRGDQPRTILISRSMARKAFAGQDPVGRRLMVDWLRVRECRIVGVVGDSRYAGLRGQPQPEIFFPHAQVPYFVMNVVARIQGDAAAMPAALRQALNDVDPAQPAQGFATMRSLISQWIAPDRFAAALMAILALISLALAATGTYAAMAFLAGLRRKEIGVRMALGARRTDVIRMMLTESIRLASLGMAAGAVAAAALSSLLQGALHQVEAAVPRALLAALAIMAAAALAAGYAPARRASQADPLETLRSE